MRDRSRELSRGQALCLAKLEASLGMTTRELATWFGKTYSATLSLCQRLCRRGLLWKQGTYWGVTSQAAELLSIIPRTCPRCMGKGFIR